MGWFSMKVLKKSSDTPSVKLEMEYTIHKKYNKPVLLDATSKRSSEI